MRSRFKYHRKCSLKKNKDKQSIILPNWIIRLQRTVPLDETPSSNMGCERSVLCHSSNILPLCAGERQKILMTVTGLGLMVKPIEAE